MHPPIAFRPGQISPQTNEVVVAQHAEEAAFLWSQRSRAIHQPHYLLRDLAALDERVEANLDGLAAAGAKGWEHCVANLEHTGPGPVFALTVTAFRSGKRNRMSEALMAACASPETVPGFVSALGWLEQADASAPIQLLLRAVAPEHRMIAMAAIAIHRIDPGPALNAAVEDGHDGLRARGLRAVGELKRHDLVQALLLHLRDSSAECRFWAAWSLCLLQPGSEALALLTGEVFGYGPQTLRALNVALRSMSPDDTQAWVSRLRADPSLDRVAVVAAGIVGDPASVPSLIHLMGNPNLAKLAGESFSLITGVDLRLADLTVDYESTAEPDEAWADHESNMPIPGPDLVGAWWRKNRHGFVAGRRYLCGKPVSVDSAHHVLAYGRQRQRHAAALELACLDRDGKLFETRARGDRQMRWTSPWA